MRAVCKHSVPLANKTTERAAERNFAVFCEPFNAAEDFSFHTCTCYIRKLSCEAFMCV